MYDPAKYLKGAKVRIADRQVLEEFMRTWTLHHPLEKRQLKHAGKIRKVRDSSMYHGGDVLYWLHWAPGVWHERLLSSVE